MSLVRRWRKLLASWRTLPKDAALAYRDGGLAELWSTVAERSVYLVARRDRLVVIAQPLHSFREVPPPDGVTIAEATEADWPEVLALVRGGELARYRQRIAAGRVCLVARRGVRLIGYTWYADRLGPDVTACPLPLPASAAYLCDLYVVPSERGNGVGSSLASARLGFARSRGFREGWRMISRSNHASFRTLAKTSGEGTRIVGELRYVKLLSRLFPRFDPRPASAEAIR